MSNQQYQIEMRNIVKSFGGVRAVDNVSFQVRPGEIHALMGENGAGKSTLMKVLAGVYEKDSGEIYINGELCEIKEPKDGISNGISVIYQELALINDLTVAENIFIDNLSGGKKFIDWKRLYQDAHTMLKKLGFGSINERMIVSSLSVSYQQVVEICKAISRNTSVLVLDEPTSVLASNEVDQLFDLLQELKNRGVAIIYISHRLEEIFKITDRITVMKDGKYVKTVNTNEIDKKQLISLMVGRSMQEFFPQRECNIGEPVFEVRNICNGRMVQDVTFDVRRGEVFGISGLVGSGRTETLLSIFGEYKKENGEILLGGKPVRIRSTRDAMKNGIGLLPEDRKTQGLLLERSLRINITLAALKFCSGFLGWIERKKENAILDDMVQKLDIRMKNLEDAVSTLSGGNQQKIAIARLLASGCKVLLLDEPTRGVDIGAKVEIYKIINKFVEQNGTVVMVSSEMPEVIAMCDRVMVMREGKVMGFLNKTELDEQNLIKYSMGVY